MGPTCQHHLHHPSMPGVLDYSYCGMLVSIAFLSTSVMTDQVTAPHKHTGPFLQKVDIVSMKAKCCKSVKFRRSQISERSLLGIF